MDKVTTITSRTKSGKQIEVAIVPVSMMRSDSPDLRQWEASALAVEAGCGPRAWRLVDASGKILQLPSRTTAEAAAISGPTGERHDW